MSLNHPTPSSARPWPGMGDGATLSKHAYSDIHHCTTCGDALAYPVNEDGEALDGGDLVCLTCILSYVVDMRTGTLTRAPAYIERLTAEAASERARNLHLEEGDDHASILSDLGDLLDQRDTWREGEGTVDQVRRICSERDALRAQVERLTTERAALLASVEGVDLGEVLKRERVLVTVLAINPSLRTADQRRDRDLLFAYQAAVAPALAREVARLRDHVRRVEASEKARMVEAEGLRAALEEARLTLAAEQGKPEKAAVPAGVYIASRTRHGHRWVDLREQGAPIISTWINEYTPASSPDVSDLWARCVREASSARRLYAYIEGDGLEGGLIEIGAALSAGVPVSVVCAEEVWAALGSWKHHPLVSHAAMLAADAAVKP